MPSRNNSMGRVTGARPGPCSRAGPSGPWKQQARPWEPPGRYQPRSANSAIASAFSWKTADALGESGREAPVWEKGVWAPRPARLPLHQPARPHVFGSRRWRSASLPLQAWTPELLDLALRAGCGGCVLRATGALSDPCCRPLPPPSRTASQGPSTPAFYSAVFHPTLEGAGTDGC